MGLLDEIKAAQPRVGGKCAIPALLDALGDKDRTDLVAALADPVITASSIAVILDRRGHKVGVGALRRHRRGECRCGAR